ncbi:hypothetical protein TRAPUB_9246 [Trametes pubescens]|uniref:NYN domain-containing protein n=1 Tax=Trametes pubescens TaxID=154538 RepID=A0A1M2W2Q2_TRAPU|nr:hypothetical protein TRAPUB_9246 [Trametes pubescens]
MVRTPAHANRRAGSEFDAENCTPPCNIPGYDVVNNIQQVAHQYGSVKLFKAYLELSEQSSSKSIGLRSELQSCGVSLTDCPHNGRKDVADKMMIGVWQYCLRPPPHSLTRHVVDMLTYAIDNPAPATVVLISGDRDFVYAVSVLRLRRYRVVVVAPYTAHGSLKSQASAVLDWEADIMRRTTVRPPVPESYYQAPPDDALRRSPRRPLVNLAYGGAMPPVNLKSYRDRRPSLRAAATAPAASLEGGVGVPCGGVPLWQGRHLRTTSAATVDSTLRSDVQNPADRSLYRGGIRQTAFPSFIGYDDEDEDMLVDRQPIPDILDVIEDLHEARSQATPNAPSQVDNPTAAATASSQMLPHGKPIIADDRDSKPIPPCNCLSEGIKPMTSSEGAMENVGIPSHSNSTTPEAPQPVDMFPNSGFQPCIVRPATAAPLSRVRSDPYSPSVPSSPLQGSHESSISSSASTVGPSLSATAGSSVAAIQPIALPIPKATMVPEAEAPPTMPSMRSPSSPDLLRPVLERATEPPASSATPSVFFTPLSDTPGLPIYPLVPEKFRPLVDVLETLRKGGHDAPLRTTVAVKLIEVSPKVYAQAGVTRFKEYSSAAEQAGIVTMGGYIADTWISLKPEFRDLAGSPFVPTS